MGKNIEKGANFDQEGKRIDVFQEFLGEKE